MKIRVLWNSWWKKALWSIASLLLLLAGAMLWFWLKYVGQPYFFNPWLPPQLRFDVPAAKDLVGDLGGMPVIIPRHFPRLVEYDGDPGWGGKRQGPRPERTHASRLKSFGVDIRYPDMAGLSSRELEDDKKRQTIYNTMWIDFGVTTGEFYPGDGFLDRRTESEINETDPRFRLEKVAERQFGLDTYIWGAGRDPVTGAFVRPERDWDDVFIHRDRAGHVKTYIRCSRVQHEAAPCSQSFNLGPAIKAKIYVHYRRGLVPHWRDIQQKVTDLVLSWRVEAARPDGGGAPPPPQ